MTVRLLALTAAALLALPLWWRLGGTIETGTAARRAAFEGSPPLFFSLARNGQQLADQIEN